MKIAKWGNSLAVRLPAIVVEAMGLKEGDDVEIAATGAKGLRVEKAESRAEWLDRMRKYRGRLPADFKFDREEANSRGD
jgi:antitoxin MazE